LPAGGYGKTSRTHSLAPLDPRILLHMTSTYLHNHRQLRELISQAIANADESQFDLTWEEFEYLVDVSGVTNRTRIERLRINLICFMFVSVTVSKNTLISYHPNSLLLLGRYNL
jgi:hypothetical protein